MNLQEAYQTLNLSDSATEEEVKKAFKKLAAKNHPDVNKSPDAEANFKKINEAYQVINTPRQEPNFGGFGGFDFNPFEAMGGINFNNFQNRRQVQPIELIAHLSFKDSILGCKYELKFNRKTKCNNCNGTSAKVVDNGCVQCHGTGTSKRQQGNIIYTQKCSCNVKPKTNKCKDCVDGCIDTEVAISVNIPGGVTNDNVLRLAGLGHYAGSMMTMDQYSDAFLRIDVEADDQLSFDGNDVISNINISLLEALQGCKKSVKTIFGNKDIDINSLVKNKDKYFIHHAGVNDGNQTVIVNVDYPEPSDINRLITVLQLPKLEVRN